MFSKSENYIFAYRFFSRKFIYFDKKNGMYVTEHLPMNI